jgi:hypothetical protein
MDLRGQPPRDLPIACGPSLFWAPAAC